MNSCTDCYNSIKEDDVPNAIEALTHGPVGYKYAEDAISDVAVEIDICKQRFPSSGRSPSH